MKSLVWPRLVLIGAGVVMVGVWVLAGWSYTWGGERNVSRRIEAKLAQGDYLREVRKLEGVKPDSFLVVYIEKGYTVEEMSPESAMSCPGEITGQPIRGRYNVALWQSEKMVSDVVVPEAGYNMPNYRLALVYRNIRGNIYQDFERSDKLEWEVVPLINLRDYTGDGKAEEFLLVTTEGGCGFWDGLVAGYDQITNRVAIYSDWIPRFNPDSNGNFHYLFECGDHGNQTRVEADYKFDRAAKRFIKVAEKETPCPI